MPSVATAPTATAAQAQAAGSRMTGFYLGVGGVKVDCLFDTSNFIMKDADGKVPGSLGLGIVPSIKLHVLSSTEIARFQSTAARGGGNGFVGLADASGRKGYWGYGGPSDIMYVMNEMNNSLYLGTNGTTRWLILADGRMLPGSDNAFPFGGASNRVTALWSVNGTVQTSDADEKNWLGAPSTAEISAAKRIAGELGFFQWLDALAEKGDHARLHFGVRAQAAWQIMADEGLIDPITEGVEPSSRYAFLCYDAWDAVEGTPEERDDDGKVRVAAVPPREAGNRFGVNVGELALFLIAAQEARLAALEAAA